MVPFAVILVTRYIEVEFYLISDTEYILGRSLIEEREAHLLFVSPLAIFEEIGTLVPRLSILALSCFAGQASDDFTLY